MGNAGSGQQRDRHKSGELPPSSPGKEGTAFVFDKTPNKFLYQSSREEEEDGYGVHKISQDSKDEYVPVCIRAQGECDTPGETSKALPTVFKWEGGGKQVYISGTFSNWKTIPMVKSHGDFVTIVDLPEGEHQYKFLVDGDWVHNPSEPIVDNSMGSKNNVIKVKQTDFEVFDALAIDSMTTGNTCQAGSPPGDYNQEIPMHRPQEKVTNPPILPPHLLQVILNKDTPLSCEPTLLPEPNHVMLNHLYALSIKDGVMVLSATHRYRKKYVTTLLYKPI